MATPSQLDQVRQAVAKSPALKQRLAKFSSPAAAASELVRIAGELGIKVTEAEVKAAIAPPSQPKAKAELSDAELATVAGGSYCWSTHPMCWNTDPL
jgi:predicted ribosomally synthesized peptide with nif11-like leader